MAETVFLRFKEIRKEKIIGVNISSTIYIQGEGASERREEQLNSGVGSVFKNVKGNISVSFNINYKYDPDKKEKDLKLGENLLVFSTKENQGIDRSHVNRETTQNQDGEILQTAGKTGEIYKSDWNYNNVVYHETGHFLGLSDRYAEKTQAPFPYFDKDLMGKGRNYPILGDTHYQAIINYATYLSIFGNVMGGGKRFVNRSAIDLSNKGELYPATPLQMENNPF